MLVGRVRDVYLTGRRGRLDPLRRMYRIAHDRIRELHVLLEHSGHDFACADADTQPDPLSVFALELAIQHIKSAPHRERAIDGTLRVSLERDGRTEHRHRRVADVLVDGPTVASDLLCECA